MGLEQLVKEGYDEMGKRTYIVTAAQYNAPVNHKALDGLEAVKKKYDNIDIVITPMKGAPYEVDEYLHPRLQKGDYIINTSRKYSLNKNIEIYDAKLKPSKIIPFSGQKRFVSKNKSTIIPSTKQAFEPLPTMSDIPRMIFASGAITKPHYNRNAEQGEKAYRMHEYGAIVVDVYDDTYFNWRNLVFDTRGKFDDPFWGSWDGSKLRKPRRAAVFAPGDAHYEFQDPIMKEWTENMARLLRPKVFKDDDIVDMACISHHNVNDIYSSYLARKEWDVNKVFTAAVNNMKDLIRVLPKDCKYIVPHANHNEHFERWLRDGRFTKDPENLEIGVKALSYLLDGKDPLEYTLKRDFGLPRKVYFIGRNEEYKVNGVHQYHGDSGANGARWTVTGAINNDGDVNKAHSHSAMKREGVYSSGTRTYRRLGYNNGSSGWNYGAIVQWPSGKRQVINPDLRRWKA